MSSDLGKLLEDIEAGARGQGPDGKNLANQATGGAVGDDWRRMDRPLMVATQVGARRPVYDVPMGSPPARTTSFEGVLDG
jgi:hypothetical protein